MAIPPADSGRLRTGSVWVHDGDADQAGLRTFSLFSMSLNVMLKWWRDAGRQRSLVLSDYDYLRDDAAAARFEEHAAAEADQAQHTSGCSPSRRCGSSLLARSSSGPCPASRCAQVSRGHHLDSIPADGIDYDRVLFTCRTSGDPAFARRRDHRRSSLLNHGMPNHTMLRRMLDDDAYDGAG